MPVDVVLYGMLAGGAALAVWTVSRFPRFRPPSLLWTFVSFFLAQVLFAVGPAIVVTARPYGVFVTLLGTVLPLFYVEMLAAAWLVTALLSLAGGDGPRGGHRIRLPRTAERSN